jgi:integrase
MDQKPKRFTDIGIRNLQPPKDWPKDRAYEQPDPGCRGLRIVLFPSGKRSFVVRYRRPGGRTAKLTLGDIPLADARRAATNAFCELREGRDPGVDKKAARTEAAIAAMDTIANVCTEYMNVKGKLLRTAALRQATLKRLVYPALGARPIASVTRTDYIRLFDKIADNNGPVMADQVRAILSKILRWYEGRHDTFVSPITAGLERKAKPPGERARSRTLNDDELRRLWAATAGAGAFPALIRFLLLTGARLQEAARITKSEISVDGWLLPAHRNKVKRELLRPLSTAALDVINKRPKIADCEYIFTVDGRRPLSGFSRAKLRLSQDSGVSDWRIHDLRRTARSLMSRAGVISEHAEQALGHVLGGVRATYDRHHYYDEKRRAFDKLAVQLNLITDPQSNVVTLVR